MLVLIGECSLEKGKIQLNPKLLFVLCFRFNRIILLKYPAIHTDINSETRKYKGLIMNKLTLREIEQWVDNDEGLYNWWKSCRQSKRDFMRENREELEQCINNVIHGSKPAHYLAY